MLTGRQRAFLAHCLLAVTVSQRTIADERALPRIAATGEVAGGTTDVFHVLDGSPIVNGAGDVAFRAGVAPAGAGPAPPLRRGIWKGSAATGLTEAIALAGDPAPGAEEESFASFSLPALAANGDVLFIASTDADQSFDALFRASPPGGIARVFDVDIVGTRLDNLAVNAAGEAMLQADTGLYFADAPDSFGTLAAVNDTALDTGGADFSILNLPAFNDARRSVFLATISGAGVAPGNDTGAWHSAPGGPRLLFREGAAAPARAANGNQLFFGGPSAEPSIDPQGAMTFLCPLTGGQLETQGIFRASGAADLAPVAIRGPLAASSAGDVSFTTLFAPAMGSDGSVYFAASASVRPPDPRPAALRGVSSLWRSAGGGLTLVAGMGGAAPGTAELFGRITGFAVNPDGRVAFGAELYSPASQGFTGFGLWAREPGGAVQLVVRTGDTVRLSESDVRTVAAGADSIRLLNDWRSTTDSLRRGPAEGIPTAAGAGDQLVYRLRFDGGGPLGSFGFFGLPFTPATPRVRQPVVNSLGDAVDLDPGDGACDTGSNIAGGGAECTLRAAIQEANALDGAFRITFAIDTPGAAVIFLQRALPAVAKALVIDGTTQPDGRVSISGSAAGAGGVNGLTIQSEGCSLRGLTVTSFSGHGVESLAGSVHLFSPDVSANGGDGIHASSGGVEVTGGLRAVGNAANGISAFLDVKLEGEEHEVSSNGQAGIRTDAGVEGAGSLKMSGNGTRRSAVDCAARAHGAIEATGDVVLQSIEARSNCGSGIVADGDVELDFGFIFEHTRHGVIAAEGDIRLGVQHEISRNRLAGLHCANGAVESFSILELRGNEENGIFAKEVRLVSGEVVIEESGLNGVETSSVLDSRVPLRVSNNGKKRTPLDCQERRVGGIVATGGSVRVSSLDAAGNCGSAVYCDSGAVTIDGRAVLTDNSQFGIWCPAGDVIVGGAGTSEISRNGKDGIFAVTGPVFVGGQAVFQGNGRLYPPSECAAGSVAAIYTQGEVTVFDIEVSGNCGSGIRAAGVKGGTLGGGVRLIENTQFGIVSFDVAPVQLFGDQHEILRNGLDGIFAPNAVVRIEGKATIAGNNRSLSPQDCDRTPPARGGICTGERIEGDEIDARLNCGSGLVADEGIELKRLTCSQNTQFGAHSTSGGLLLGDTGHFFSQNGRDGISTPAGRVEIRGVLEANRNGRHGIAAAEVKLEAGEICNNAQLGIDIVNEPGGVDLGAVRIECGNGVGPLRNLRGVIVTPRSPGIKVAPAPNPSPGDTPPGQEFPAGFNAVGAEESGEGGGGGGAGPLSVEIVFDLPAGLEVETYFNYGPTAGQPAPHWYEFRFDGATGAEILPGQVILHLVDGLRGDDDLAANGSIGSLGGAARTAASGELQLPGDCNQDGLFNISDPICVLGFLFLGAPAELPCGDGAGDHGSNRALLDWQPDGGINLTDAVSALAFLFLGGPPHALVRGGGPCVPIAGCPSSRACP